MSTKCFKCVTKKSRSVIQVAHTFCDQISSHFFKKTTTNASLRLYQIVLCRKKRQKKSMFKTPLSTRFSLSMEMGRRTRDGTAETFSRDQILRHGRGQGNINFPCSADHEQDWQPYPVDPYSAICDDHTLIHTYIPGTVQRWASPRHHTVDPRLLYHRGTRLKAIKWLCLHSLFYFILFLSHL